tara:strand:+ start:145 stop:477 length:333 start_codon:yes stop_codon:yes gene_type:complete
MAKYDATKTVLSAVLNGIMDSISRNATNTTYAKTIVPINAGAVATIVIPIAIFHQELVLTTNSETESLLLIREIIPNVDEQIIRTTNIIHSIKNNSIGMWYPKISIIKLF